MLITKNNYFKSISFLIIFVILFLTLGAQFLHNHSDSDFHNDCPACQWLINSVFIFSIFFIFLGLFLGLSQFFIFAQAFPTKTYCASQYLRSPPFFV